MVVQWITGLQKHVSKSDGAQDQGQRVGKEVKVKAKEGERGEVGRGWRRQREPNKICSKYEGCFGNYFLNGV